MAAATPGITSDFYKEKGRRQWSLFQESKANKQYNNKKTIPDTYLPLIGQNFVKKYAYLQENLTKHISIPLSLNFWIC